MTMMTNQGNNTRVIDPALFTDSEWIEMFYAGGDEFVKQETRHPARHQDGHTHCYHRGTDGTVRCPDCGKGAGEFIEEAGEFLDKKAGGAYRGLDDYFGGDL